MKQLEKFESIRSSAKVYTKEIYHTLPIDSHHKSLVVNKDYVLVYPDLWIEEMNDYVKTEKEENQDPTYRCIAGIVYKDYYSLLLNVNKKPCHFEQAEVDDKKELDAIELRDFFGEEAPLLLFYKDDAKDSFGSTTEFISGFYEDLAIKVVKETMQYEFA